jgi:hypothetical protein
MSSPADFVPSPELWSLTATACDGTLTEAQRDQLETALLEGGHEARQFYVEYLDLHATLAWRFRDGPTEADNGHGELVALDPSPVAAQSSRRALIRMTIAVAVLLLVVSASYFRNPAVDDDLPEPGLRINFLTGSVALTDSDGAVLKVTAGMRIGERSTIQTKDEYSLVTVVFDDATKLLIAGNSIATISDLNSKLVELEQGTISASVTPQHNGAMVIRTPLASIEVVGTEFSLAASAEQTDVRVTEGRVKMTRSSDGESVVIAKGKRAVTDTQSASVVVESASPVPDTWDEAFESGVPSDWRRGGFAEIDLPENSTGAVRSLPDAERPDWFSIQSPQRWMNGLYEVHSDSHLNMIYRIDRPGWVNIFMITRNNDQENPRITLNLFNSLPVPGDSAGEWRRATIPIAAFHRKVNGKFTDKPPQAGDLCFGMMWSWFEPDRGLVIDRVWVSRGGPGEVRIEPLTELSTD